MKRFLSIVSLVLFASSALFAQKSHETSDSYTLSFEEVSLSDALKELNELSSDYKISFMYDELEDFRVSTRIVDKTIPEAVNQVVGFYPVSVSVKKDAGQTKIFVECVQKADMKYKGRILDTENNPVAYANVVLFTPVDTTMIAGGVTNEDGYFAIPCDMTPVLARLSFVGYETVWKECGSWELGTIFMSPGGYTLDGVDVEAHVSIFQMGAEGLVTNVENTPLSKLGSADDVLRHVPGVVKRGDDYEVFGKGKPMVYVNGRKVNDQRELIQMGAADIRNIELITNPGAKYDASVNAVIKIRTLRKAGDGLSVDAMTQYTQGEYDNEDASVSLNYRHDGLDVFASAMFSHSNSLFESDPMWQEVKADTMWRQDNYQKVHVNNRSVKLDVGFNYQFNDLHVMGAKLSTDLYSKGHTCDDEKFESVITADGKPYDSWNNFTKGKTEVDYNRNANAYYIGSVGKLGIDLNMDYVGNRNTEHTDIVETCQIQQDRTLSSDNIVENRMLASKLTLTYPMLGGSLDFGGEYINTHRQDDYIQPEQYVPTSYSTLEEQTLSPYFEFSKMTMFGQLRAGLRYEHVAFDYYMNDLKVDDQCRRFDNFYPSASFATRLFGVGMQLSYSVRTTRPTYSQLSNNVSYGSRFTMQTGNPLLKNSTRHVLSLAGGWNFVQFNIDYTNEKNPIIYSAEQNTADPKVIMVSHKNIPSIKSVTPMLILAPSIGIWRPQFMGGFYKQWLTLETINGKTDMNQMLWQVQWNNILMFRSDLTGEVNLFYQSPGDHQNIHLEYHVAALDLALTKTFFNDRLSLKISGEDLLNRRKTDALIKNPNISIYQLNAMDTRNVVVTLRYRFNNTESKYKGTGAGNEEKGRL